MFYHWAMATRQPPALTILYMCCTGGTECLSLHSWQPPSMCWPTHNITRTSLVGRPWVTFDMSHLHSFTEMCLFCNRLVCRCSWYGHKWSSPWSHQTLCTVLVSFPDPLYSTGLTDGLGMRLPSYLHLFTLIYADNRTWTEIVVPQGDRVARPFNYGPKDYGPKDSGLSLPYFFPGRGVPFRLSKTFEG